MPTNEAIAYVALREARELLEPHASMTDPHSTIAKAAFEGEPRAWLDKALRALPEDLSTIEKVEVRKAVSDAQSVLEAAYLQISSPAASAADQRARALRELRH